MKFKAKTIYAKLEATYGTDATPANTDAVATKNLTINPYTGNEITRDLDRPALGNQESINTNPYVEISFDVEIAGSGTAGDAPAWGSLLRACGFSETVDVGVDVKYALVSAGYESITIDFLRRNNAGGHQLHKVIGARGTVTFGLSKNQIPMMSFRYIGFYATPVDVAATVPDYSAYMDPVPISEAVTSLDIGGYTPIAEAFSIDVAQNLVARNVINQRECVVTDRAPAGQTTVQAPDVTTKNFFSLAESHAGITTQAVQLIHGVTAGNIVQIDAPKVQLKTPSETDSDGELHYQLNMSLLPATVDDELVITVK